MALALIEPAADETMVALEVMSTAEFDVRSGFVPAPGLVGVTDVAVLLGVSRQRLLQMIDECKLPGTLIGRARVTVEALADRQPPDTPASRRRRP